MCLGLIVGDVCCLRYDDAGGKGCGKKGGGKKGGRPRIPRPLAVVPPRPKMMPPGGQRGLGGQWLQAFIWIPPHINYTPPSAAAAGDVQRCDSSEDKVYETTVCDMWLKSAGCMLSILNHGMYSQESEGAGPPHPASDAPSAHASVPEPPPVPEPPQVLPPPPPPTPPPLALAPKSLSHPPPRETGP